MHTYNSITSSGSESGTLFSVKSLQSTTPSAQTQGWGQSSSPPHLLQVRSITPRGEYNKSFSWGDLHYATNWIWLEEWFRFLYGSMNDLWCYDENDAFECPCFRQRQWQFFNEIARRCVCKVKVTEEKSPSPREIRQRNLAGERMGKTNNMEKV